MKKMKKIVLVLLVLCWVVLAVFGCTTRKDDNQNDIVYSDIEKVSVNADSVASGMKISEFDITKVKILVTYKADSATGLAMKEEQDEQAKSDGTKADTYNYTVSLSASLDMVKAEDKDKLSKQGTHVIRLLYGKYTLSFTLELYDDSGAYHKVAFYDENAQPLCDVQYVKDGGRAVPPALDNRVGYEFVGWKNKEGEFDTFDNITEDKEYTVVFESLTYTVKYLVAYRFGNATTTVYAKKDKSKGDYEVIATVNVPREENGASYYPSEPSIDGYTFVGWQSQDRSTFLAVYEKDKYNVTFIYQKYNPKKNRYADGKTTETFLYYPDDKVITEPENAYCSGVSPANDYQFIGWYVIREGKKVYVTFPYEQDIITETTFYADYVSFDKGSEGLSYKITNEDAKTCVISGYSSEETIVVIPETATIDSIVCTVTGMDDGVFKGKDVSRFVVSNTHVYFSTEDGVLYNEDKGVLYVYPSLSERTSYSILDTTEEISSYAFYGSKNLTNVDLPYGLLQIDDFAFSECTALTAIIIPESVNTIEEGAFSMSGDNALASVTFAGTKITALGDQAFFGLRRMEELHLPASVNSIGDSTFYGCSSLRVITAENSSYFTVYNGALYDVSYHTLYLYPAKYQDNQYPEVVVHDACRLIKRGAFYQANISCLTITSDTELETYSVVCPTLRALRIDSNTFAPDLDSFEQVFAGKYVPDFLFVLNTNTAFDDIYTDKVVYYTKGNWSQIGDNLFPKYSVDGYVFSYNTDDNVISITGYNGKGGDLEPSYNFNGIPITCIGAYAFAGNNAITSFKVPVTVETIEEGAFYGCENLKKVTLSVISGVALQKIENEAFRNCSSLETVAFENSLQLSSFGNSVFEGTPYLENEGTNGFVILGGVLLKYNGLNSSVTIPKNVTYIASDAFKDKGFITSVSFQTPSVVAYVDSYAFQNCIGLQEIKFPKSTKYIADNAFYGCTYLFSVEFASPKKDVSVGYYAFYKAGTYYNEKVYQVFSDSVSYTLDYIWMDKSLETNQEKGVCFIEPFTITGLVLYPLFLGWYYDNNTFSNQVVFPIHIEKDTKIYAKLSKTDYVSEGLEYELNEDGYYSVSGYNGSDSYVVLPTEYKNLKVSGINSNVFGKSVNYVLLSSTITRISENAFADSSWYKSYPGDFVVYDKILIGYKGSSKEVHVPDAVTSFSEGVFRDNIAIETVFLPEGVREIVSNMFRDCVNLKSFEIGKSITSVGEGAFKGCNALKEVTFAAKSELALIAADSFEGTPWLRSQDTDCISINGIFYKYTGSSEILHIPTGTVTIAESAFEGNVSLDCVYIPASVKTIYTAAFKDCALSKVVLSANNAALSYVSNEAFYNCYNLNDFDFSLAKNLSEIGKYAFYGCTSLHTVAFSSSVSSILEGAFEKCGLLRVSFPNGSSLKEIGSRAFYGCQALEEVAFTGNSSLKKIGDYAFAECIALRSFSDPKASITEIGKGSFYDCISMDTLELVETAITDIGEDAFENVGLNKFVESAETKMDIIGNILLKYNGSASKVVIPKNIILIYNSAFENNTYVETVVFEEGSKIAKINNRAFYRCTNLTNINFPTTISYVGDDVMTDTKWYTLQLRDVDYIVIGNTLIKYNVSSLQDVVLPEQVSTINKNAFYDTGFYDLKITDRIRFIKEGAFDGIKGASWREGTEEYNGFTITIQTDIKEGETIPAELEYETSLANSGCVRIYVENSNILDTYRLNDQWSIQAQTVVSSGERLMTVIETFTLSYNISTTEGKPIVNDTIHALYSPKEVEVNVSAISQYEFVGWFLDKEFNNAVTYPLILTDDMTIYAKCVDYNIGSNPQSYLLKELSDEQDGMYTIEGYLDTYDKKVIIITEQSKKQIYSITGSLGYVKYIKRNYYANGYYSLGSFGKSIAIESDLYYKYIDSSYNDILYVFDGSSYRQTATKYNTSGVFYEKLELTAGVDYTIGETVTYDVYAYNAGEQSYYNVSQNAVTESEKNYSKDLTYARFRLVDRNIYRYVLTETGGTYEVATGAFTEGESYAVVKILNTGEYVLDRTIPVGVFEKVGDTFVQPDRTEGFKKGRVYATFMEMEHHEIYYFNGAENEEDDNDVTFGYLQCNGDLSDTLYINNEIIEEITFANNCTIEVLGEYCFAGMINLRKVTLPRSLKKICKHAFEGCVNLEEIVFTSGIEDLVIESYAFSKCTSLTSITIPEGVKSIGNRAFSQCNQLIKVTVEAKQAIQLYENLPFEMVGGLKIYIPSGCFNNYAVAWEKYLDYLEEMSGAESNDNK